MTSPIDDGAVLITGASSGIGRSIAEQIAHRATTLVLVARRKERLDELAAHLKTKNPNLKVVTYACDVSDRAALDRFVEQVKADVGAIDVLVNNAGLGDMGVFDRSKLDKQLFMIDVNVAAVVRLTHAFLPGMVERKKGAVLNISSGFGLAYLPGFSTYAATKYFVTGFTESLHTELSGTGVLACQICPGPVATEFESNVGNFTDRKVPSFLEISSERCARESIAAVDKRRALVVPHIVFKIAIWLSLRSPRWLVRLFLKLVGRRVRKEQSMRTA